MKQFDELPDPDDKRDEQERLPIQFDVYGVKAKTELPIAKVEEQERPRSWGEVWKRTRSHLLSIAENLVAVPAYALELSKNVFRSLNSGLVKLDNHWRGRIHDAQRESDRIEETKQQELIAHEQKHRGTLADPAAAKLASDSLLGLLEEFRAKGIAVEIRPIGNNQVGIFLLPPDQVDAASQIISEEVLPGINEQHVDLTPANLGFSSAGVAPGGRPRSLSLSDLDISPNIVNVLRKHGIETVDALVKMSANELEQVSGIGKKSIEKIRPALAQHGLTLRDPPPRLPPGRYTVVSFSAAQVGPTKFAHLLDAFESLKQESGSTWQMVVSQESTIEQIRDAALEAGCHIDDTLHFAVG